MRPRRRRNGADLPLKRDVGALRARLMRLHSPRLQMFLIVALTAAAGFLTSAGLLEIGLDSLWRRYALSVVIAYLVFLLLLRMWVRLHRESLDIPDLGDGDSGGSGGGQCSGKSSNSLSDILPDALPDDVGDVGVGVLVVLAIAVLGSAVIGAMWVIWIAPTLLAELILDIALGARLYRRLRGIESADWLRTAVRRTALPFLLVLLLFSTAGAAVQHYVPDARSIGDVLRSNSD